MTRPDSATERRALAWRYLAGAALGLIFVALIARFQAVFPRNVYFLATVATVVAVVFIGGFGPAAVTVVTAYLASAFYSLEPRGSLWVSAPGDQVRLAVSLGLALLACAVEGRFRRERRELRRRAQELSESSSRYRILLEEASDAIVVFDADLTVRMANVRATQLLGRSREALLGLSCDALFGGHAAAAAGSATGVEAVTTEGPSAASSAPPCVVRSALSSADAEISERPIVRPDGTRFIGELSARRLPDESVQVIVRDVTTKLKAAAAVRAERDLLDGIIATSSSAIVAIDVVTRRPVFANQRLIEISGVARPEVTEAGSNALPWITLDEGGQVVPAAQLPFARVLATEAPVFDMPLRVRFPDGRERRIRVNAAPLRDSTGRLTTVVQTIDDVTERLQTERALVASEEKLAHIAQAFPGAVYQFALAPTGEMRFTYCSEGIRELIGLSAEDALRDFSRVWALIGTEQHDEVRQSILQSAATQQPWRADLRVTTEDRRVRWIRGTAYPESDRPDGVVRWNGIFLDVTDFKELESHLMQAQKMESVGRLAGGIAHDFNNILTAIRGNVDLLLEDLAPTDERATEVMEIRDAAERAGTLTRQLLAFSRKQFLQPRELDLNALVRDMEKMLRRVIGEDIALLTVPGDGLGMVRADPGQLQQVLLNLVVNARDAMPDGGLLTIDTRNVRLAGATAAAAGLTPGEYVCLVVRDTGHGMSPDVQARIFEPFFTTKSQGRGTGLGLAMVYGIVQQSGGSITVESEPERGSIFRLFFPRVTVTRDTTSPPAGASIVTPSFTPTQSRTSTILLVEDDGAVRQLAMRMLRRAGYDVRSAQDAYEALTMADAQCSGIDLVISDVVMPGMSGRDLAQELRRRRPDLRLLFISGYLDIDSARLGLNRRTRLLHKPFTQDALAQAVQEMLALPVPA